MDKQLSKASDIEEENSASTTRLSAISKSSQGSPSPRKPRLKQSLQLVVSKQLLDVQHPSASLVAAPSGAIRARSKSNPGSTISQLGKKEASNTDDSADRVPVPQHNSSANGDASEAPSSYTDVKVYPLPDSKEGLSLNTLRSSVQNRSSLLSQQRKKICEDGMAFYEYLSSSMPASLEGAEILVERWRELQPATDSCVNMVLEIEDERRKLAIMQDVHDHPEKHKPVKTIADGHTQSEMGTEAKTSITGAIVSENLTAREVEARRDLQNDLQNVLIWIDELYSENLSLSSGLDDADLAKLELDNEQKERISENKSRIKDLEMRRHSLELNLIQVKKEMAAAKVAA